MNYLKKTDWTEIPPLISLFTHSLSKKRVKTNFITLLGPVCRVSYALPSGVEIEKKQGFVRLILRNSTLTSLLNLSQAMLKQSIKAASEGHKKNLFLNGVGYRFSIEEGDLVVSAGRSNQYKFEVPTRVKLLIISPQSMVCWSPSLKEVAEFCSSIIRVRPGVKDKYNNKGIWKF